MSSTPGSAPDPASAAAVPERRRNAALRALIDEMLFQVRGMQNEQQVWSPDERAQAEAELARIMGRVRDAAARPPGEPEGGSATNP